ncbi:MAG: response regulator [Candidatus Pacebacteria bacterium]|nr:response regulator [Candidatus Paceibacterota bacterium]
MKKKKILIIEDEKILGQMYKDKFLQAGFNTTLVTSAEEAIKKVSRIKPDLILLDILLPRENGIGFLTRLMKKPEFASVPVVAFSNFDDPGTRKKAFQMGVKDYLIKTSFTPQQIIERIKNYLK